MGGGHGLADLLIVDAEPPGPATLSPRHVRALIVSLVVAALAYLLVSLWGGWHGVLQAGLRVGFGGIVAALALSLLNYGLRFVRWQYYLGLLEQAVPAATSLRIYLSGFALTTTPGKAGELVRSVLLATRGVPYRQSVAAFFSERLSDLIAVLLLAGGGALVFPHAGQLFALLVPAVAVLLLLLQAHGWLGQLKHWLQAHAGNRLLAFAGHLVDVILHSARLYAPAPLLIGLLLGVMAWAAEGLAFWLLAHWMGLSLSLETAVFIYAFSMLAGAVSFLPGGLGGAELVMIGLLALNGVARPEAVALTLLIRMTTLWFAVALGLAVLIRGR
ncbi:MAG: lysylphosphatidylglycerol synthase transmembrane domain-containing protein [Acidiferrobacteraceae bacterium]